MIASLYERGVIKDRRGVTGGYDQRHTHARAHINTHSARVLIANY